MDPKRRQTLMLVVAVCTVGALALDRVILTPQLDAWNDRSERIAKLETDLVRGHDQAMRRADYMRRWREMEGQTLPGETAAAEDRILKAVDRWARDCRLTLTSIKPKLAEDEKENRRRLEFQASARGSMESIAQFLWSLETADLPLHVDEVDIASHEQGKRISVSDLALDIRFDGLMGAAAPAGATPESRPAATATAATSASAPAAATAPAASSPASAETTKEPLS